jgi:hypothetical protein
MRRTYISPEFTYSDKNGSLSNKEIKTPFGSKMMEIEDQIFLNEDSIIWFENSNSEQLDFLSEQTLVPKSLDIVDLKRKSHTLILDNSQNEKQKNLNSRWIFKVNILNLLTEVIFAKIKNSRTFEGILSNETPKNNINTSIRDYISKNIISRYKFESVDFWIRYNSLSNDQSLKYSNFFNPSIKTQNFKFNKYSTNLENSILTISFNQDLFSTEYNFEYYYTIKYSKI